jgi:hypothetical protein
MGFNDMLNAISEYWFIIIAIAAFFHYYYKKEMTKYEAWQNMYFDEILAPFHLQYLKNPSKDINEFINDVGLLDKTYVPSYIHYLTRNGSHANMVNVMLVDYERNNPSPNNLSVRAQTKILDVIFFCMEFVFAFLATLTLALALLSAALAFGEVFAFIQNGFWNVADPSGAGRPLIIAYLVSLLSCIIITGLFLFLLKRSNYSNCYSADRTKVEKLIAQKLKRYEKISPNLIYYSLPLHSLDKNDEKKEDNDNGN